MLEAQFGGYLLSYDDRLRRLYWTIVSLCVCVCVCVCTTVDAYALYNCVQVSVCFVVDWGWGFQCGCVAEALH